MDDLERELDSHPRAEAEEQQASGLSAEDARLAARRAFGSTAIVAEDVRAVRGGGWLEGFARDVRYGIRTLRKHAGFTTVAVLTLALGIGANTAIFSALDALMLRPLPFARADELVRLYATRDGGYSGGPSAPDVHDYLQASRSFQQIVVYDAWRKNVGFADAAAEPQQMRVGLVPAAYFEVLGVTPIVGRLFTDDESREGRHYVAAIGEALWKARFGGDRAILGRTIRINDEPYTIVAVMPDVVPEWMEPGRSGAIQVWTPLAFADTWLETSRGARGFSALGRLKPGVPLEQAQAELSTIAERLAATHPVDRGIGVAIVRVADTRAGTLRPMLFLLIAAVSLILLIACVNLANLLLARNATRERELALRSALGASNGRLVRQLLVETLLLSLAGAAIGLALAQAALAALVNMHPPNLPQLDTLGLDWRVLAFTVAVSLATSLMFGLGPAIAGARLNLVDALKQGGRSAGAAFRSHRMRNALVAAEMAMSLMLLVGAGLLVQSLARMERQSLGIRQDHLLKGHFYLPGIRYPDSGAIARFADEFARRVRALPGVVNATITTAYPPTNGWTQMIGLPDRRAERIEDVASAEFGVADAHFTATLGIPLLRGRDFAESDTAATAPVALVSEEFRKRYFPDQDPIGRQIHIGPPPFLQIPAGTNTNDSADVTIVGVIGDFRNGGLVRPPEPHLTVLYAQHPLVNYGFKDIVVRTATPPRVVVPEIRRQLHQLDPDMPFAEVQTIDEHVELYTGGQRVTTWLLVAFAAGGLALALVGLYGVVSFLVAQRRQELAVRIAIGASHGRILWIVLAPTLGMAALGAAVGLAGAWSAQKLTSGVLFGISPVDPATFAAATAMLLAVAAIAGIVPAARVASIDPATTLRLE